jgi:hypothetical protein
MRKAKCKAMTKAGTPCQAPTVEKGLCFFHAHPEKAAELGRDGGRKNRHRIPIASELAPRRLRSFEDVQSLLEETVNRVRQGPFDLRAANSIGFLAGILLKAVEHGRMEERLLQLEAIIASDRGNDPGSFQFTQPKEAANEQEHTNQEH